jgi:long-chain fatty acid transport protein
MCMRRGFTRCQMAGSGMAVMLAGMGVLHNVSLHAEGFRNPTAGAFSLGRAGGRIAQVDDSSAVATNPANLADVTEAEFEAAPGLVYFSVKYDAPGVEIKTSSPWKYLPHLFTSIPIPNTPLTFGFGVTTPFGLSNEWDQNNPFRAYSPYYSELMVINANPSLAWKINDQWKVGVGVDVFWSQLDLRASPAAGVYGRYFGEGTGEGGNFGVTWEPVEGHRLALTYRSPVTVDYSGTASITGLGGETSFNSTIVFPTIISGGYGIQLTKSIRLESDVEWIQFSRFHALGLNTGVPALTASAPENWKNTFTAGLGGDWTFSPGWVLRAGYQYYESPVRSGNFTPSIPDANQHALTAGIGYRGKHHGLELAYGEIIYQSRNITADLNPLFDGKYQVRAHLASLTYRYSF